MNSSKLNQPTAASVPAQTKTPRPENQSCETALPSIERVAVRHSGKILMAIVAVALLVRLAAAFAFSDINPGTANTWEYGEIAANAMKYHALVREVHNASGAELIYPTAYMPPFLSFIWMGVFWLLGVTKAALAAMIAFNVACGTAIAYYVYRIAKTLFRTETVALAAAAIAGLHPVFVFSVATYHALNFYILLLLFIVDLSSTRYQATFMRAILIGVLLGVAALTRTEYLVLGGAVLLGALWRHRLPWTTLASLVVAAAIILPWTIRNYIVMERFIPVANSAGYNMFKGFNPEANGSGHWVDTHDVRKKFLDAKLAAIPYTRNYESDVDDMMHSAAKDFIATHPWQAFVILPVKKILLFWFFDYHDPVTHSLMYQISFWLVFLLSTTGIVLCGTQGLLLRNPDHRTIMTLFVTETLVMASYAVHARYRMNVDPFLFCYAAYAAAQFFMRTRTIDTSPT